MNGNMIKSFIIFIILAACIQTASAIPPIPESYWGYATLNGAPAAIGTSVTVEVYDTGEIIGSTSVQYENGGYSINVEFDDPNTSEDEGANEGNKLTWKVGGIICSTPAQETDIVTSGKANSDFVLISDGIDQGSDQSNGQGGTGMSSGQIADVETSDEGLEDEQPTGTSIGTTDPMTASKEESAGEMPVDKKPAVPGFSLVGGMFFLLVAIQILRINK